MIDPLHYIELPRLDPAEQAPVQRVQTFTEICRSFDAARAAEQASRCLGCGNPYCAWTCPLHNRIPDWLKLVSEDRLFEAADLAHTTNPLPEICGRVCPQDLLCEGTCTLHEGFGAVTIGAIERFIADAAIDRGWRPDVSGVTRTGKRVAIVGAGPAGLSCADRLVRAGVDVAVYDRYQEIGGLLSFGIPEFKLESGVVRRRRSVMEQMGIQFNLGTEIGRDILPANLLAGFDAVFLAMGVSAGIDGNLPGKQLPGVHMALPYLASNANYLLGLLDDPDDFVSMHNKHVVVLGAGDTAMDCNRTAIRQGAASVTCTHRADESRLPGSRREVIHAREEGVRFLWNRQPVEIVGDTHAEGVRVLTTGPADNEPCNKGSVEVLPGTEQLVQADKIIIAFGFRSSPPDWLSEVEIDLHRSGLIVTGAGEPEVLATQTTNPKVFAGGDMVTGSRLVVHAIHQGRLAARDILTYLAT